MVQTVTEAELARSLKDGSLDGSRFRHVDHIRLGRWYVRQYGIPEALTRFTGSLRAFAEAHGSTKYHETITWAYLLLIADRMELGPPGQTWNEFAEANADLLEYPGILRRLYRDETLASTRARERFVLPDRSLEESGPA